MLQIVYAPRARRERKIEGAASRRPGMSDQLQPTFSRQLTSSDGHVHRFLIAPHGALGWEVREERDDLVLRRARYTDWHRVERARTVFELQSSSLRDSGWVES
jgi:hypothetical protein